MSKKSWGIILENVKERENWIIIQRRKWESGGLELLITAVNLKSAYLQQEVQIVLEGQHAFHIQVFKDIILQQLAIQCLLGIAAEALQVIFGNLVISLMLAYVSIEGVAFQVDGLPVFIHLRDIYRDDFLAVDIVYL